MKVAVVGASGKLGSVIAASISAAEDLELIAGIGSKDSLDQLLGADVVIDVSTAAASRVTLPWLAEHGIDAIVGTTGFTNEEVAGFDSMFGIASRRCFIVPNFAVGAALLMRFAEQAAPWFDTVEIVETHHNQKRDAPSGTARLTAQRIAAARTTPWANDATESAFPAGVRGGEIDGIHVHSLRMRGAVAHEEVVFGTGGQMLTLRHDSFDRTSFADGALLAARKIRTLPTGLTTGLEAVL